MVKVTAEEWPVQLLYRFDPLLLAHKDKSCWLDMTFYKRVWQTAGHIEAFMLTTLSAHSHLPIPAVYYSSPRLLLMSYLPGDSQFNAAAQQHAAELLAALHTITAPTYGLERDTLIGGLPQPNQPTALIPKLNWLLPRCLVHLDGRFLSGIRLYGRFALAFLRSAVIFIISIPCSSTSVSSAAAIFKRWIVFCVALDFEKTGMD